MEEAVNLLQVNLRLFSLRQFPPLRLEKANANADHEMDEVSEPISVVSGESAGSEAVSIDSGFCGGGRRSSCTISAKAQQIADVYLVLRALLSPMIDGDCDRVMKKIAQSWRLKFEPVGNKKAPGCLKSLSSRIAKGIEFQRSHRHGPSATPADDGGGLLPGSVPSEPAVDK